MILNKLLILVPEVHQINNLGTDSKSTGIVSIEKASHFYELLILLWRRCAVPIRPHEPFAAVTLDVTANGPILLIS